jgi:hypothetical protein
LNGRHNDRARVDGDLELHMRVSLIQRIFVFIAAIVAIGASFLQATGALGLTPAEFANAGASTVRAASYAFAIWGLIYAGLLSYAIYQLVPGWADETVLRRFAWPSVFSMLAIGAWLVAAGADWRWATIALIALAALVLIVPLCAARGEVRRRDALLIVTPLALLAGWLTIATALNAVTVLTAEGLIIETHADGWAVGGLVASAAVGLLVFLRSRAIAYPLPLIWGLIAVFIAERAHRPEAAWVAAGAAFVLGAALVWRIASAARPRA